MCNKSKPVNLVFEQRTTLISHVKNQGWRFTHSDLDGLHFICKSIGCKTQMCVQIGTPLAHVFPCSSYHRSRYGGTALLEYKALVAQLVARRKSLGLSQEDITACTGLADAHINKLESFHRIGQFSTMQLWAETLGLELTLTPAALPDSTCELIDQRSTNKQTEIAND